MKKITLNSIFMIALMLSCLLIDVANANKIILSKNKITQEGMSPIDKAKLAGDCIRGLMASVPQTFCWKKGGDAGIIPTGCPDGYFRSLALCYVNCDPGYDFFGGVCWQRCDAGYVNHGATCFKNIIRWYFKKSYIPNSITNFSDRVPCPLGYYRPTGSALCYRDCKSIEMENCGIGACSSDSDTCVTTIIDMGIGALQSAVDIVSFVASFGATSIAQPAKAVVNNAVKKVGKAAMKRMIKSSVKSLKKFKKQIFSKAIKKVKDSLIKAGKKVVEVSKKSVKVVKDKFGDNFQEKVIDPSKDTIKSNVLGTICTAVFDQFMKKSEEEEKKDYPAEIDTIASVLDVVNIKGSVEACSDLSDGGNNCAKNVITGLSTFDPTGLLGLASTFMHPICDVPNKPPAIDPEVQKSVLLQETLTNPKCILIFDGCDFQGNSKQICDDLADLAEFDNKISSIVVGTQSSLIVYEDKNFNGLSFAIGPGEVLSCLSDPISFIGEKSFDNSISSIMINKQRCIIFATGKQTTPGVRPEKITNNFACDTTNNTNNPLKKFSIPSDHNWLYLYTYRPSLPILEFYRNTGYGNASFIITSSNFYNVKIQELDRDPLSFQFFQSLSQTQVYLTNNSKLLSRAMDSTKIVVDLKDAAAKAETDIYNRFLNQMVSFKSFNFPNNFMRHRNAEVWSESGSGQLYNNDASFFVRPALNGRPGYVSFESVNYPGWFMRHKDFLLFMSQNNDEFVINDASFKIKLSNIGVAETFSLKSSNYPQYFIRHFNSRCSISMKENSDIYNRDSSWLLVPGLARK